MIKNISKKNLIIASVVLVIIVIIVLMCINKDDSQKEKLESLFTKMSAEYYEDFYYNQIGKTQEEREKFLTKFKTSGIQFSLDSLSRYNSEVNKKRIKEFINLDTNEACDTKNTISVLYPKKPYKKNSYEIKIKLDCGFDDPKQ